MPEINSVSLENMNNGAHFLFMSNVLEHAESNATIAEKAAKWVAALKEAVAEEDAYLKISRKLMQTDSIKLWNRARYSMYSAYKRTAYSYLFYPDSELAGFAKILNQHVKDYGIDAKMQLDKKTGLLINFISDLETKYKAEVAALSLTALVGHMKVANEQVRSFTEERFGEQIKKEASASKDARLYADKAYRALVRYVNALACVSMNDDLENFVSYVNMLIKHYKQEVLGGSSSSGSGSKDDKPEDDRPVIPDEEEDEIPDIPDEGEEEEDGGEGGEDDRPVIPK